MFIQPNKYIYCNVKYVLVHFHCTIDSENRGKKPFHECVLSLCKHIFYITADVFPVCTTLQNCNLLSLLSSLHSHSTIFKTVGGLTSALSLTMFMCSDSATPRTYLVIPTEKVKLCMESIYRSKIPVAPRYTGSL